MGAGHSNQSNKHEGLGDLSSFSKEKGGFTPPFLVQTN